MDAAFIPEVNDELDTQNFEKFDESENQSHMPYKSGPWRKMLSSKDINFVGYTYKNFEIVNDFEVPGMAELKKITKSTRPSIKSLFDGQLESSDASYSTTNDHQPLQGSILNLLPPQLEATEKQRGSQ